jgi:signal transduction histidine kinase
MITSGTGKTLLSVSVLYPFIAIACILGVLLAVQILGLLFSFYRETKAIRKILAPINEIALKADELSRLSFSEDKYQMIEDALEHIDPENAEQGRPLSFGDSDLIGVEAAMNNLLLRMRDTMRQQSRFVNDASHELRTPIAVIQGYANMLDRWGKTDEKILDESITAIKNEADHMNYLVEQLLFLARGDAGRTSLSRQSVSTDAFIRDIYEESLMIDEKHRYRLKEGEASEVSVDPGLMKQAVRILIDNAAKYTPEGEEIILSYGKTDKGRAYLQVQDLGRGISESELPHIFERFFRADDVRASAGTGLGLSIAKWIVDKHGGHFEVLSRKDLGTRIRIVL